MQPDVELQSGPASAPHGSGVPEQVPTWSFVPLTAFGPPSLLTPGQFPQQTAANESTRQLGALRNEDTRGMKRRTGADATSSSRHNGGASGPGLAASGEDRDDFELDLPGRTDDRDHVPHPLLEQCPPDG